MSFHPLEVLENIQEGYRKVFRVEGLSLLLLQHGGQCRLLENICPHAGYPMEEGKIIDGQLRCPMHGYLFDLDSGACTYYTEGLCRALKVYEPVEREGWIGVML